MSSKTILALVFGFHVLVFIKCSLVLSHYTPKPSFFFNGEQSQWEKAFSIRFRIEPLDWNLLFTKMTKGHFDVGNIFWTSPINDPIYTLNAFRFVNEGTNFAKWEHPEYQELLYKSDYEVNSSKRVQYLQQAEQILLRELPVIPAFYPESRAVIKHHLTDIAFKPQSAAMDFRWGTMTKKTS